MQDIFTRVTFVGSQEIRGGLLASIAAHKKAGLIVISLERAYLENSEIDGRIEITRSVDSDGNELLVRSRRMGSPDKSRQFEVLRNKKNIALVDDVVFSGQTIIETISELNHRQANVHAVTTAIGVKDGIDNLKKDTTHIFTWTSGFQVGKLAV
ncbi:MAG: phosphoribosyltransferase [Patescibacteria group bacterium]